MLSDKRAKIRKQLRAQDLARRFAIKRQALMEGCGSIFFELMAEMEGLSAGGQYEFNMRLLACVKQFPEEEGSYCLITNWLLAHPGFLGYYQHLLTDAVRVLEAYLFCLHTAFDIYFLRDLAEEQLQSRLGGFAQIANNLGQEMHSRGRCQRVVKMQDYYVFLVRRLIAADYDLKELLEPIQYSCTIIIESAHDKCQSETYHQYMEFFISLKEKGRWEFVQSYNLVTPYTNAFCTIALQTLVNLPQSRLDCIKLIEHLFLYERGTFMFTRLPMKPLINEILFLMSEIPALREPVLLLLKLMLVEAGWKELSVMLELRVHVLMTKGIEWAIHERNNSQLEHCLAGIYCILNKLSLNEQKLLYRVKEDIENVNFHQMIQGMVDNEQNKVIQNLLAQIVDNFYDEDVNEHI